MRMRSSPALREQRGLFNRLVQAQAEDGRLRAVLKRRLLLLNGYAVSARYKVEEPANTHHEHRPEDAECGEFGDLPVAP